MPLCPYPRGKSSILNSFLTHDLELTIALNNGLSESSGCMSNTSVQLVWRESVKQLHTAPLNSFKQGKTWQRPCIETPHGLIFTWWGCCGLCLWHKPTELAHSCLFCSCVCFCLYGPFNCSSFRKFYRLISAFSLCSSGLISAILVLSSIYLFMKVSFSPDIQSFCGWLGLEKHQLLTK